MTSQLTEVMKVYDLLVNSQVEILIFGYIFFCDNLNVLYTAVCMYRGNINIT